MITKERLQEQLKEFSIDELIDHLILIEKIETGNLQSENGEIVSEKELDREIAQWFR